MLIEFCERRAVVRLLDRAIQRNAAAACEDSESLARPTARRNSGYRGNASGRAETMGYEVHGETRILPVIVGDRGERPRTGRPPARPRYRRAWIRPPTVQKERPVIRVAPMARHTADDIAQCLAPPDCRHRGVRAVIETSNDSRPGRGTGRIAEDGVFVVGTDTGVGKTVVTAGLTGWLRETEPRLSPLSPARPDTRRTTTRRLSSPSVARRTPQSVCSGYRHRWLRSGSLQADDDGTS